MRSAHADTLAPRPPAESVERVRDSPKLGWMNGVKVTLDSKGMTVEADMPLLDSVGVNCENGNYYHSTCSQ